MMSYLIQKSDILLKNWLIAIDEKKFSCEKIKQQEVNSVMIKEFSLTAKIFFFECKKSAKEI